MSNKAAINEKMFTAGENRYRADSNGLWKVLYWGWYLDGSTNSENSWQYIPKYRVPNEVLKQGEL